jgi:hypothetical protein
MSKESEVQREALLGLSGKPGAFCGRKEGRKEGRHPLWLIRDLVGG